MNFAQNLMYYMTFEDAFIHRYSEWIYALATVATEPLILAVSELPFTTQH